MILLTSRHLKVIGIFLVLVAGEGAIPGLCRGRAALSHCSCFQADVEWSTHRFSITPGCLEGAGGVLILTVPPWSQHQGTECSFFQGETEARGYGTVFWIANTPQFSLAGLLVGWECLAGFTPGETRQGEADPKEPLQASQGMFSPLPCASHSSQLCRAFFPHRHTSRSSCCSITGLSTSGLQGIRLVVMSVPVGMNER